MRLAGSLDRSLFERLVAAIPAAWLPDDERVGDADATASRLRRVPRACGSPAVARSSRTPTVPAAPRSPYQYAIIRVVPHVERGEALNVGVVLLCRSTAFVGAATALDEDRLARGRAGRSTRPRSDRTSRPSSGSLGDPTAGPIAQLSDAERFHWLVAPASTIIQPSAVHTGLTTTPPPNSRGC